MRIGKPQLSSEKQHVVYRVNVEFSRGHETLWYNVPEKFGSLLSTSSDAALVALLIPAMIRGEDIHVDGVISERLHYNLSGPVQQILRQVIPRLRAINIHAADLDSGPVQRAAGVATGFSAGIDSYCLLADHLFSKTVPQQFKVTHLLFNNLGARPETDFRERYQRLLPVAERFGLPFISIHSNVDRFYSGYFDFQQTHTLRNTSAALLLQAGIGRYFYASGYQYRDIFVHPHKDTACCDPITLPLLSTDAIDLIAEGSQYTRVEKTLRVATIPDSYDTLDVCVIDGHANSHTNCSGCWKCLRTLATLDIAGYLERYAGAFDIAVYRKLRMKYFAKLLSSPHDSLMHEVIEFGRERRFPFPLSSRLLHGSGVYRAAMWSKRVVKSMKQGKSADVITMPRHKPKAQAIAEPV